MVGVRINAHGWVYMLQNTWLKLEKKLHGSDLYILTFIGLDFVALCECRSTEKKALNM